MALDRGYILNNRYRIVDILGQGGMAALYRAVDMNLGVEVAVKENLFTTEEYARQFRLEAEILATLRHSNLPRVTDHFVIEGQGQYLVMDYIEGEDLRQRIDRSGVLTDEEAIVVGVAICDALTYLHSRKPMVLHRDIKPGNVKVTPTGAVYLVDFGLAKVVQGKSHTETGARAMTPGYSPPEQYGTAHTDHRSDIYSLGATLYSSLTDILPEDGLARAMDQAKLTPIRKHNPRISRRLEQVLERALAVHPEDRYQAAEDFREELMDARTTSRRREPIDLVLTPPPEGMEEMSPAFSGDQPSNGGADTAADALAEQVRPISDRLRPSSRPKSRSKRRPGLMSNWLWLAIVLGVVFFGAGIYLMKPNWLTGLLGYPPDEPQITLGPTSTQPHNSVIQPPSRTQSIPTPSATLPPPATESALPTSMASPTSTPLGGGVGRLAFASSRVDGIPQIFLINFDGTDLVQLTSIPVGACQPSWSPDGSQIVFVSPCWKEQEKYENSGLVIINVEDGQWTPIGDVPMGDYEPSWSPDGKQIVFTTLRDGKQPKIYVYTLSSETSTPLAVEGSVNVNPSWSPDSRMIVFISNRAGYNQIWTMQRNGTNQQLVSSRRNTDKLSYPVWSPDGRTVAYTQAANDQAIPNLYTALFANPMGSGVRLYVDTADPMRDPTFSPDGKWILFETWQSADDHNIAMISSSGIVYLDLVTDLGNDFDPAVRP